MASSWRRCWTGSLALLVMVSLVVATLPGGERAKSRGAGQPTGEKVEMFAAIEQGLLDVQLIPKDSKQTTVLLKNKSDKALSVELPAAFAGVPVLGQFPGDVGGMMG